MNRYYYYYSRPLFEKSESVQSPGSRVQRPESSVQSPGSSVQLLRPGSRNSGMPDFWRLLKNKNCAFPLKLFPWNLIKIKSRVTNSRIKIKINISRILFWLKFLTYWLKKLGFLTRKFRTPLIEIKQLNSYYKGVFAYLEYFSKEIGRI